MIRAGIVIVLLAAGVLGGCIQGGSVDTVDAMELHTPMVAADWDGKPGADGLGARVLMYHKTADGGVRTVRVSGTVELLMFAGRLGPEQISSAKPLRTWTFEGDDLDACITKSLGLTMYSFRLPFGDLTPPKGGITLVARYRPRGGEQWFGAAPNSSITIE